MQKDTRTTNAQTCIRFEETAEEVACRPLSSKGGEIRDTKTLNLSRNIVSLHVLVDVSRFSPGAVNLKKCGALIG